MTGAEFLIAAAVDANDGMALLQLQDTFAVLAVDAILDGNQATAIEYATASRQAIAAFVELTAAPSS